MANFEGVAEIIRDYQKCMQPWDDNEPVDLEYCRGCGGRGIRDGMEIARLTAICRKSDCGPLENDIVRLRQQIATLEKRNADLEEGRDNFDSQYALMVKQLACKDAELEAAEKEESDLEAILLKENARLNAQILELKLELEEQAGDDLSAEEQGAGDDLSAEEQAYQQAQRQHSS